MKYSWQVGLLTMAIACSLTTGLAAAEEKTAYIETPLEKTNHQVVENFSKLLFTGKVREAIETYMTPDYVDHSHLLQMRSGKAKTGREEMIVFFQNMMGGAGGMAAAPTGETGMMNIGQIRVNDEMVTQYGPEGADIFRVVNGKITDHWDASPMEPVSLIGENHVGGDAGMGAAPAPGQKQ
jgi:predicted SnoaL-like aldol condensation-catalyzing enzyme